MVVGPNQQNQVAGEPYRFDVDEYHKMTEVGIFDEDSRVELLGGTVFQMAPIGSAHASMVKRLRDLLGKHLAGRCTLGVQDPIHLSERSEPQPDISVLKPRADYYASGHPTPSDVLLIVEVSDTSVAFDRGLKLALYARWGIPEVWIIDLAGEVVTVYAEPSGESYRRAHEVKRGEALSPAAFPDVKLPVEAILG